MFQAGLVAYILSVPAITALLGTSRGDKSNGLFAMLAPAEPTLPYIAYMQPSGSGIESMQGQNKLQDTRYRFSCYGVSYKAAKQLAEQLKLAFATYSSGAALTDGTILWAARFIAEADDVEAMPHGTVYETHVDFNFWYVDNNGA